MEDRRNFYILARMRLALAVLVLAAPAFAAVPEKGEGTITLLGGARTLVPGNGDYQVEQGASQQGLQPGGLASSGYQYDDALHCKTKVRYPRASAQGDPQSGPTLNGGSNTVSLGMMFHFLEPDDKGKPTAPSSRGSREARRWPQKNRCRQSRGMGCCGRPRVF